ncbi:MAG: hypothetical protein LRZ88_13125 [Candidatus Cloacimonetes bacterium]|nr:hypothetical protein [Candidatus Cloacimonadota bacterium]
MKGIQYQLKPEQIQPCNYRPYVVKVLYYSQELNEMRYQMPLFFPTGSDANNLIAVNCMGQGTSQFLARTSCATSIS